MDALPINYASYGYEPRHGEYGEPITALVVGIIAAVTATVTFVGDRIGEYRTKEQIAEAKLMQARAAKDARLQAREAMRLSALQGYYTAAGTTGQLAMVYQAAQMEAAAGAEKGKNIAVLVMGAVGLVSVLAILKGGK